jgi:putative ATPase
MQSACRRLMVIAAEDVGLAFPQIIPIVNACVDMALKLGMPEARIPLGDAAVLMATSPKSNSGHVALDAALADVRKGKTGDFPRHLQNIHDYLPLMASQYCFAACSSLLGPYS